jgi:methylated-DNA-[protein]-cysteine S-methyltransferase
VAIIGVLAQQEGEYNMAIIVGAYETAFGWVGIARSPQGLLALTLPKPDREAALRPLLDRWSDDVYQDDAALDDVGVKLCRYFDGHPVSFDEPLDMSGATDFQRRVWEVTRRIPRGQTLTYGGIARQVGSPRAARAVGQIMARNPWPVIVPCHRVVGHDGRLTGFGGGLAMKQRMLELEGAIAKT